MANYDYLKWDAQSILVYLRRKLLESGLLTDQLYPGSDTKILMDLFAWTFDVLTYMLNNAAADSLFADTQLYENMNRIVKLLGYNPVGYLTSNIQCKLGINSTALQGIDTKLTDICIIPKFASIDTGKTDKYGNKIKYSFTEDFIFNTSTSETGSSRYTYIITPKMWPNLYNGEFKKFDKVFTSDGTPYATFVLVGLNPYNEQQPYLIDHHNFHIYVERINTETSQTEFIEFKQVNSLIQDATWDSQVYELRLDETKNYTIKFGDDIHGERLLPGDRVHVIYLQSNGEEGKVDANEINVKEIMLDVFGFDSANTFIDMCFGGILSFKQTYGTLFIHNGLFVNTCEFLSFSNINASNSPKSYENVDEIRENAPYIFRSGGRLVTIQDYFTYLKSNFGNIIHDLWVCNNSQYTSIFYNWLKTYEKLNIDIKKYNYKFTDACDFNNVYIWIKPTYESRLSDPDSWAIVNDCEDKRTITSEVVPISAIETVFMPYVKHPEIEESIDNTILSTDWKPPIKIKIKKRTGVFVQSEQLKTQVNNIIVDYFDLKNQKMGNIIDIDEIYKRILKIGTVDSVKTEYRPDRDKQNVYSVQGLSFACYTLNIINGKDFEVISKTKALLPFQFAKLYKESILNMIEIEDEEIQNINNRILRLNE